MKAALCKGPGRKKKTNKQNKKKEEKTSFFLVALLQQKTFGEGLTEDYNFWLMRTKGLGVLSL